MVEPRLEGSPGSDTHSVTIAVVEPDVLVRMVIAEYLRQCGYRVVEVSAGEDLLAMLEGGNRIDIVLAEIKLGGEMDGFALAKRIRQAYPGTDVILTSGIAAAADKAGNLCEEGPLEKPYHPQEVVRRIHILREQRRMTRE
jgi:CheY-like chemotaxis protein